MHGREHLDQLQAAVLETVNELLQRVQDEAAVPPAEIYEAVVAGNATMMSLMLGVNPESIALAPYVATFTEAQDVRADQLGLSIHPLGRVAIYPAIGAYRGARSVPDKLTAAHAV